MISLILGGNKSGKSAFALERLAGAPGPRLLLPTGKALDMDFRAQIMDHKRERTAGLTVREVGTDLPQTLDQATTDIGSALVDSLDYWLFSCIDGHVHEERIAELMTVLSAWTGPELFLVSCEVGLGPLGADASTRRFVRALGALNQAVARLADRVWLVTAGLPITLKEPTRAAETDRER